MSKAKLSAYDVICAEAELDEQRARFWDVICAEVDIRIGYYRIGTMSSALKQIWFAIRDGEQSPDAFPFDTRQQAIDWAINQLHGLCPS